MKKYYIFTSILFISILVISVGFHKPLSENGISSDSLSAEKDAYVSVLKESIAGKEKMPSDSVYKDIQILKDVPAESLLNIMNKGFSNALGVGCDHCHNTSDWASNEKNAKQIAREMMVMSGQIRDMITNIEEIESENATINCYTCHRGEIVPALRPKD